MHDFCFTFPYATLLALGGAIGFLIRGSIPSLVAGCGCALLLGLLGKTQLSAYKQGANSWPALLLQLSISILLTLVLGKRYMDTGKVMPAGLVAGLSGTMAAFYAFKVLSGGNKISKKAN